jgi:ACT domain-containing protein
MSDAHIEEHLIGRVVAALRGEATSSRVVVAAHGKNAPGIVARVSAAIDEFDGDIRDLSQTIVSDYFSMLFVVDMGDQGGRFLQLRRRLDEVAQDLGVHIVATHEDIVASMHGV